MFWVGIGVCLVYCIVSAASGAVNEYLYKKYTEHHDINFMAKNIWLYEWGMIFALGSLSTVVVLFIFDSYNHLICIL